MTGKELWHRAVARKEGIGSAAYGVQMMVTSPSGNLVVCGGAGEIVILDFLDGKTTQTINSVVKEEFKSIDVSPDGKWFAAGNASQLLVFDESGNTKFSIKNDVLKREKPLDDNDRLTFGGDYSHARFTPDGKQLVLVHSQNQKALNIVNFETGKIVREIPTKGNVVRFDFSKDGTQVVTTERDFAARLYDLESGKQVWEKIFSVKGRDERYTTDVRFSPDGNSIAVGTAIGEDQRIRMLDPKSGEDTGELEGHTWKPWCIRFTSDSKQLYSSGWDSVVRRWDLTKMQQLRIEGVERAGSVSAVSPNGKMMAYNSDNGKLFVLDIKTGKQICKLSPEEDSVQQIAFSHDSKVLAAGLTSSNTVHLRTWIIEDVTEGDDGKDSDEHWSWPKGQDVHSGITALSFSGDDKLLAVCMFRQNACRLFSLDSENPREPIELSHSRVYGLCLSPDGQEMVTAGWDKKVRLWDTETGEQIKEVTNDTPRGFGDPRMYGALYSPDGKSIATMEMQGRVKIWTTDLEEPLEIKTVASHFGSFGYSRNGLWISVGGYDGDVAVYDTQTGDCIWKLGKHTKGIYNVSFGALDKTLLSSGSDGVCYLWDLNANAADTNDLQVTKDLAKNFAQALITGEAKEAFKAHQAFAAMSISDQTEVGIPAIDAATISVFETWKDVDEKQEAKLNIAVRRTAMLLAEMKSSAADSLLQKLQKSSPTLQSKKNVFIARRHRKRFLKRLGLEYQ